MESGGTARHRTNVTLSECTVVNPNRRLPNRNTLDYVCVMFVRMYVKEHVCICVPIPINLCITVSACVRAEEWL